MSSKIQYFCSRISQKWVFAVMSFFSVLCMFAMRLCLPLTIPKMVKSIEHTTKHHDDACPGPNVTVTGVVHNNSSDIPNSVVYDWSEYTQGVILGSFYWGFVVSHVPGGIAAERYGGKHTLGLGLASTAICTILTPLSVAWGGAIGLTLLRILMGLCEGITQPALSVMLSQWVPVNERSKISTFVYMGAVCGILLISTGLGSTIQLMDWQGVYYLFGGMSLVWYLLWLVLCYNSPREHPFISEREARKLTARLQEHTHVDPPPVPWRHLLGSAPFWALVAVTVGRDWYGLILLTDLPKYTMSVLKYSADENGLLYLVNHVAILVACLLFSWLSDWLIERNYLSLTGVRKVMASMGLGVSVTMALLMSYVGCDRLKFIVISSLFMFTSAAGLPGIKANVLDLSPNYAGTVMAISHGLAGLCGIAGPYFVGVMVPNQTLSEWRLVYWTIFAVGMITNVIFVIFGSGEVQEWNDPNFDRKNQEKDVEMKEIEKLMTTDKIIIVAEEKDFVN
ncbi:putative inorganic phosphate cotransporter [Copidosoma floridanum]|uniref:putative inorganic phosphate cotransporter n=1 Tax=Copidosoma floridanum TaxID=29053 RepID=UPI0006C990C6|nr:putative inorganic phosphate cotransporter [Copidosoma floridanum]